jgi:hypothetical protein
MPTITAGTVLDAAADRVGGSRVVPDLGGHRETLLALDDLDMVTRLRFEDSGGLPVRGYVAALQVTPAGDGRCVVTWSARYDCDAVDEPAVRAQILDGVFRPGLSTLSDRFHTTTAGATR